MRVATSLAAGAIGAALAFVVAASSLPAGDASNGATPGGPSTTTRGMPRVPAPSAPRSGSLSPSPRTLARVAAAAPSSLTVTTARGALVLRAPVDPMMAAVNADGSWAPVEPPHWDRAVWLSQSAPAASPSSGTTAVYGHACHHHVCSFDKLRDAALGDSVVLRTAAGTLTYRVFGIGSYPKHGTGSLNAKPSVNGELMLVTCAYEEGDESLSNLVVTAELVAARPG